MPFFFLIFQDIGTTPNNGEYNGFYKGGPNGTNSSNSGAPVVKRRQLNNGLASDQNNKTNLKTQQYRCSLINLEESCQDDELDAILGELSVLESQFEEEISQKSTNPGLENLDSGISKQQPSPVASITSRYGINWNKQMKKKILY